MAPRDADKPVYELFMADGLLAGQRFALHHGRTVIGRDNGVDIVLPDDGVSRRRAQLDRDAEHVVVQDLGSTNGTWVNGARLAAPRSLASGDVLGVGAAALRLEGSTASQVRRGMATRQGVSLGRVGLVAGFVFVLLTLANFAIQWLTESAGFGLWLSLPVGAVLAALLEVLREVLQRGAPRSGESATSAPSAVVRRRTPVGVAVAMVVLLIGGGGLAAAYGIGTFSAYLTGNEVGIERLPTPVEHESRGLTTTVASVEQTANFTRVGITVHNGLRTSITLPLFDNAKLSAEDGLALDTDPFRSSFSETIASGQTRKGVLVFEGRLPPQALTATLAFARVHPISGPDSLIVGALALEPE